MTGAGSAAVRRARAGKPRPPAIPPDTAVALLRTIWRIRCFEERIAQLHKSLQIQGLVHLSIGGEGVAATVCGQLRDDDAVYSGHRAHGHALAKGAPMAQTLAELMGRSGGLCRGLGGSMHLVDATRGLMGATGVVGGNLPLAAGDALAKRLAGSDAVTVVFFGDGAVQAGHFHETVNLAALWELPLIFVCENNGMAEFTSRAEHTTVASVADVVSPYGFARATVDGSDVAAVHDKFAAYLEQARMGEGPFLLECLTHRRRGHYEGDQQQYRDEQAEAQWSAKDPLARWQERGRAEGWLSAAQAQQLERDATAEVEQALAYARQSPPPTAAQAAALVYAAAPDGAPPR